MPINLNDVEAADANKGFEPLPEGTYPLRVTDAEEIEKEDKVLHKFECTVQFGPFQGRKVWQFFNATSEGHAPYLKLWYQVLGVADFSAINPVDMVSCPLRGDLVIDEYGGKKNNKIRLGAYFEWDGKEETAWGEDEAPSESKSKAKNESKGGSPFSNEKKSAPAAKVDDDDEPPFS